MPIRIPLLPRWIRWTVVLLVAVMIFTLSILTAPPEDPVIPAPDLLPLDKWRHFLAYATLSGALAYATADWSWRRWKLAIIVIGTAVLYGIGVEFGQSFIPERYFSIGDAWANALGGLLVIPWFVVRPYLTLRPINVWVGEVLRTS